MSKIEFANGAPDWNQYIAGGTIAAGDAVRIDGATGKVVVAVTSGTNLNLGVAINDAVLDQNVQVAEFSGNDLLIFPVEAGSAVAATVGDFADLNSPDGLTLTATNSDVIIKKVYSATLVGGHFRRTVRA